MHSDRLFKKPVEEHPPGPRPSPVKSEGKFVQVGLHMVCAKRALVGAEQPPFHERCHAMDARENFVRFHVRGLEMCASKSIVIPGRQRVGRKSVGQYRGAGFNMSQEKRSQSVGLSVGNDLNAAATESFGVGLFHGHRNENFSSSSSTALSWTDAADHRFIHLHIAGKPCVFGLPDGTTKPVQHRPSGLVGTKSHKAVERFGRNPVLRCRHVPSRSEPYGEWRFRVMEDRARCCRNPATARFAPPTMIFHAPPRVPPEHSGQENPDGQRSQSR